MPPVTLPVATTAPPVFKFPAFALPVTVITPPTLTLPIDALDATVTRLLVLLNVKAVLVLALPSSLNTTPVFEPGITMLPEILPITLPKKFRAVILPVAVRVPFPPVLNVTLSVTLPTTNPVSVPVLVMFG